MCHLGGGSMKDSAVTRLKGGAPWWVLLGHPVPPEPDLGGLSPRGVWGSAGSPWSVEPCSAQLARLSFPGWEQGVSRWAVPAGQWHRRVGRERPGWAMAGAPHPIPK